MRVIDTATKLCAVIGNPVEHSLSPAIHNAAFQAANLNYVYLAFHVANVQACLDGMRALPSFRGLSVTIPHKAAVMPFLDEIDPMARFVGSVNTVTNEQGRLVGSTTDGPGTLRAFREAGVSLAGQRVLFLGSGGAVRAVAFAIALDKSAAAITILGRTPERVDLLARDLREKTGTPVETGALTNDLAKAMETHDILIQGTPTGMYPDSIGQSLVPEALLKPHHVVFDMVYRPLETRLVREAKQTGCRVVLGSEMLLNQAVLQFELWTGLPAPLNDMRRALVSALGENA